MNFWSQSKKKDGVKALATRCQTISLLWEATCARNYGIMTMLVGATLHIPVSLTAEEAMVYSESVLRSWGYLIVLQN